MEITRAGADDAQALRRCVRELAALSTLSAVWDGSDPRQIAVGLSGVLCRSLSLAVVYVRLTTEDDGTVEAASEAQGPLAADRQPRRHCRRVRSAKAQALTEGSGVDLRASLRS